jgi:imidazolonepropionase-like amidohydrolase
VGRFRALASLLLLAPIWAPAQEGPPTHILISNAAVWDGTSDAATPGMNVLVEDNLIKQISAEPIAINRSANTKVIDAGGRVLMPGLIDMHTHLMFKFGVPQTRDMDASEQGASAYETMQLYIQMGYTTLRDVGGNSLGLSRSLAAGRIRGPRLYSSGGAISSISGHNDLGLQTEDPNNDVFGRRGDTNVVTGPMEVREAVRRILRGGGSQIKIMPGGGVASQFDPLEATTLMEDELRAAVEAAADFGTYVCAHAYNDESINRFLDAGGRCIEHGFLIDEKTIKRMKKIDAVMSLQAYAAYEVFKDPEVIPGFTPENVRKGRQVNAGADQMMRWVAEYEIDAFGGSDLWPITQLPLVPQDLVVRKHWFSDVEILRQNTSNAGRWLAKSGTKNPYRDGPLGVIEIGAYADVILVEGNPLEDVTVLVDYDKNIKVVIKDGEIFKNSLEVLK